MTDVRQELRLQSGHFLRLVKQGPDLGCLAPDATQVSVVGAFNNWQPGATPLQPATAGWWHTICRLPHGAHAYRFWIEDVAHAGGGWQRDGENPATVESGLATPGGWTDSHSVIEG